MLWNLCQQKLNQTFISQIWESLLSLIVTLDNGIRWCWDDQFATTNTNTSHPLLSQASFLIYFCKTRWKVCFSWNWENISSNQKEKYENSSLFCIRCLVFSTPMSSSVKLWEVATTACGDSTNTNQDYALPMLSRWQSSLLFIISEDLKIDFLLISICNDLKFALSFE